MQLVDQPRRTPVSLAPAPSVGGSLRRAGERVLRLFRAGGDPPDFPGAVGASDLELIRLARPADVDHAARDAAIQLLLLGPHRSR